MDLKRMKGTSTIICVISIEGKNFQISRILDISILQKDECEKIEKNKGLVSLTLQ